MISAEILKTKKITAKVLPNRPKPQYITLEGAPPLSFSAGNAGNLKNYRIFGNNEEQIISDNLFYKVIANASFQADGTIIEDSSFQMLFAKIKPNQDYIAAKDETNSTALTYVLYNVYDHDPVMGSSGLLSTWKSTAGTGIVSYTGSSPVYLGIRIPQSITFPHLNIGTTICDYDDYEVQTIGVGDKVIDSQDTHYNEYRIPIMIGEQTFNIYLSSMLNKMGTNTEYIDFVKQKKYNYNGTSENANLPALSFGAGDNTLTFGTTVQPSKIQIKGKICESEE